jgi:His Kinase A (phospho-acceptor) domain
MSHELRALLNAIIGLTEMMVTNVARFGTEKALEPLRRVNGAGNHLLRLINEILNLSKIEAGKLELIPERADLARSPGHPLTGSSFVWPRLRRAPNGHRPLESIPLGSARRPLTTRQPFGLRNENEERIAHV